LPTASLHWITLWVCLGAPPSTMADPHGAGERTVALGDLPASLPPDLAAEIAPIDASYRAVLRQPLEQWRLGPIRESYKGLLERMTDANAQAALRARLERVGRHADAAESARAFQALLERSRRRDREVAAIRSRLVDDERRLARPYDAEGLMQPSARKINGQKVFALIGPEGTTQAYLEVPAGLDASPLLSRRVGVRGEIQYSDSLRARLISVRDLDPLEGDR